MVSVPPFETVVTALPIALGVIASVQSEGLRKRGLGVYVRQQKGQGRDREYVGPWHDLFEELQGCHQIRVEDRTQEQGAPGGPGWRAWVGARGCGCAWVRVGRLRGVWACYGEVRGHGRDMARWRGVVACWRVGAHCTRLGQPPRRARRVRGRRHHRTHRSPNKIERASRAPAPKYRGCRRRARYPPMDDGDWG